VIRKRKSVGCDVLNAHANVKNEVGQAGYFVRLLYHRFGVIGMSPVKIGQVRLDCIFVGEISQFI